MNKNRTIRTASAALFAIIGIVLVIGVTNAEGETSGTYTSSSWYVEATVEGDDGLRLENMRYRTYNDPLVTNPLGMQVVREINLPYFVHDGNIQELRSEQTSGIQFQPGSIGPNHAFRLIVDYQNDQTGPSVSWSSAQITVDFYDGQYPNGEFKYRFDFNCNYGCAAPDETETIIYMDINIETSADFLEGNSEGDDDVYGYLIPYSPGSDPYGEWEYPQNEEVKTNYVLLKKFVDFSKVAGIPYYETGMVYNSMAIGGGTKDQYALRHHFNNEDEMDPGVLLNGEPIRTGTCYLYDWYGGYNNIAVTKFSSTFSGISYGMPYDESFHEAFCDI